MYFILNKPYAVLFVFLSCSQPDTKTINKEVINDKTFYLRSAIKSMPVGRNYVYCDSTLKGDLSCFIEYNGKKYLKQEKLFFDSIGKLNTVLLFKPEGNISYKQQDLLNDTLLMESSGWKMNNNIVQIDDDKILKPFSGNIVEVNETQKMIYYLSESSEKGKQFLYVFEYW